MGNFSYQPVDLLCFEVDLFSSFGDVFFLWCNAAGRGLFNHQLANGLIKVLRLYFPMNNVTDLFGAAVTLVVIVKSSWSTVEIIVQASDDIIKVVPKMKTRSSDLCT